LKQGSAAREHESFDGTPAQLEQEAPRGRRAALRASLPTWRERFRAATPRSTASYGTHAREPFDDAEEMLNAERSSAAASEQRK
jgi:hypothetical protein